MLPELLAPYASVKHPIGPVSEPKQLVQQWFGTVAGFRPAIGPLAADSDEPAEDHPAVRNCMARGSRNRILIGYGDCFSSLYGATITPIKSDIGLNCIWELVSSDQGDAPVVCRDLNGNVECLTFGHDGILTSCFQQPFSKEVRLGATSRGFCVSDDSSIMMYDVTSPEDPFHIFSEGGGPVAYSPTQESILYHGDSRSVGTLDLREGTRVMTLSVHPAAISLASYTHEMDYRALAVHPSREPYIAAYPHAARIVQIFDTRNTKAPVWELAMPGREDIFAVSRHRVRPSYQHMSYSPSGDKILFRSSALPFGVSFAASDRDIGNLVRFPSTSPAPDVNLKQLDLHKRWELRETNIGVCWDSGDVIVSLSDHGNVTRLVESDFSDLPSAVVSSVTDTEPIPVPQLLAGFDRILATSETVEPEGLEEAQESWILSKIGYYGSLKPCRRHPHARNSVTGSFFWNECVMFCPRHRFQDGSGFKRTRISQLVSDYAKAYGKLRISNDQILKFLRTLELPEIRVVNDWTVEVSFIKESDPLPPVETRARSQLMILPLMPNAMDFKRNKLVNAKVIEDLRAMYGIHPQTWQASQPVTPSQTD
jgi:hypothetical protein